MLAYPAAWLFTERVVLAAATFRLVTTKPHGCRDRKRRHCTRHRALPPEGRYLRRQEHGGKAGFAPRSPEVRPTNCKSRHQTLIATLDWSHIIFPEVEQVLLRRVAIFVGHFTLEAALAVAEEVGIGQSEIAGALGNLVNKSLIGVWTSPRGPFYRLLDTTRAYALEKLATSGEQESIAERHATFSIQMLESNPVNLFDLEFTEAATSVVRDYLGNIRVALEWSFGPKGNDPTAIRLAAAASQLLLAMSRLLECRTWMEKAIDRMTADCEPRHQMKIQAALALSLMYTEGNNERVREAFSSALNFAQRHEDARLHLSLLSGMSMYLHGIVDAEGTYELALRGVAAARKTGSQTMRDRRFHAGAAYCLRSDQQRAQEHLKRSLRGLPHLRRSASQYLFDFQSSAFSVLAHSLFSLAISTKPPTTPG